MMSRIKDVQTGGWYTKVPVMNNASLRTGHRQTRECTKGVFNVQSTAYCDVLYLGRHYEPCPFLAPKLKSCY